MKTNLKTKIAGPLVWGFFAAVMTSPANGAEISGVVQAASGRTATVRVTGDAAPNPGDKAEIFFKLAGTEDEISVANGSVLTVEADSVQLQIDEASGEVVKDQSVRIKSEKPHKRAEAAPPAAPTPPAAVSSATPPPVAPASGRDASFVFVDMNQIFKDFPKTREAEARINGAKATAKAEYDDRVARKLPEAELSAWRAAREKELQDQAVKERAALVDEITATIKRLTPADVNVVWDSSGTSLNGVPVAVFTPAQADASQRISAALTNQEAAQLPGGRGLQIGLVDMNRAFKNLGRTKDAEAKINAAKNAAKQAYDKRADAYKKDLAKVDSLSGAARDRQIAKVRAAEQEINGWRATKEKELQDQALTMRTEIVKKLTDAIAAQVSGQQMRLILDRSGAGSSGVPIVLWSSGIPDFSDEIVAALNAGGKSAARPVSLVSSAGLKLGCVDTERVFKAMPGGPPTKEQIAKQEGGMAGIVAHLPALAEAGGYNLIFDTSGQSLNGVPFLVNGARLPDLTDALIAATK